MTNEITNEELARLKALANKATPGPWRVIEDKHATYREQYEHTERRVFTEWDHPQLQGPLGIVNSSVGIGEKKGDPARWMVSMDAINAAYIAAMCPNTILALIAKVESLAADAERYKIAREDSQQYYFAYRNPDMGHAFSQVSGKKMDKVIDIYLAKTEKA